MLVCNSASGGGGGGATVFVLVCNCASAGVVGCHCAWPELFYYPLLPFSLHGPLLLHHHCTLIPLSMQCIASQAFLLQQHLHFTAVPCICVLLHPTPLHFTELTLIALSAMGPCICYREIQTSTPNVCPVQNFFKTWHMLYTLPPLLQAGVKK